MRILSCLFSAGLALSIAGCSTPAAEPGPGGGKGEKGDPGASGPPGQPGPTGLAGPAGSQGVPGATGPAGAAGPAGPMGPMGGQGAAGMMGPMGMTGASGSPGPTGLPGPKGDPGTAGSIGPAGAPGPKGDSGAVGPVGPAGTAGSSGAYTEDTGSFAGFTATSYSGAITNGRAGMHAACAAAFPGSHLCHAAEFILSNSTLPPPTAGAWLDPTVDLAGSRTYVGLATGGRDPNGYSCRSWADGTHGNYGTQVSAPGGVDDNARCDETKPLACCSTPTKVRFAGFTPTPTSGNGSGRAAMHRMCATAFPGSHLCHVAEYVRSTSAIPVPASAAWLDPSAITATTLTGLPAAGRSINGYNCTHWSSDLAAGYGTQVNPSGSVDDNARCNETKAVACCQ